MRNSIAIIGAGVSGLTCGIVFAEKGYRAKIFAHETGQQTTSAVAAAIWYPYDAEPADQVIVWSLQSYDVFRELSRDSRSGVSMIELRNYSRTGEIEIPPWAHSLGARSLGMTSEVAGHHEVAREKSPTMNSAVFSSGFVITVPLIDTTIYLDYLARRFRRAGGTLHSNIHFNQLEDLDAEFDLIINCAGIGARTLVPDSELEPHRGQVAIVPRFELKHAVVCDDEPLTYAIPRANDCVFGGTNDVSEDRTPDSEITSRIVAECCRVLAIPSPRLLATRVGLRPFRQSGVRVEATHLHDGRIVIHNYGHGGSGFTLSWGCARQVMMIAAAVSSF
jgi:D-amino-acid oxidase